MVIRLAKKEAKIHVEYPVYSIDECVFSLLDNIGMPKISLDRSSSVCIKPNICIMKKANTGATTSPLVVKAIIEYLQSYSNCNISIVESDATTNSIDASFAALGWRRLAKETHVDLINLTRSPCIKVDINGYHFKSIKLPSILMDSDLIINVPKLKAHELTGITGALKNQFGSLPRRRKVVYHKVLDKAIADVNTALPSDVVIMDAVTVLQGGVITGIPMRTNLISASIDPVANDAFAARLIGYKPQSIRHIVLSEKAGVGTTSFRVKSKNELPQVNIVNKTFLDRLTNAFLKLA